jgi:hypothetical protein
MAWVSEQKQLTNRAARVLRGGPAELPTHELANVISGLCDHYSSLMLDTGFRRDIEHSQNQQSLHSTAITSAVNQEFHCHINEAIALLAEAGVDGELAVEALRAFEEEMRLPGAQLGTMNTEDFFKRLHAVKKAVCALKSTLVSKAEAEAFEHSFRRITLAGVGLALVGLVGSGLVLISGPVTAPVAAGTAVLSAIGATLFQHFTTPPH